MKYKIEERADGKFYIYRKRFLKWVIRARTENGILSRWGTQQGGGLLEGPSYVRAVFSTRDEAKQHLKEYLQDEEKKRAERLRAKTVVDSTEIEVCYE